MNDETPPTVCPPTTAPRVVTRIAGKYEVVRLLGQGGMGVVYEATDSVLLRRVALKLLPGAALDGPRAVEMFLEEARAAARLRHPCAVTVHDAGRDGDDVFIAMELVEGGTAQDALAAGPLPPARALAVAADVCRALAAAHAAGLIHRDVKPGNILLPADGPAKLGDFGLAVPRLADGGLATQRGRTAGTPAFMSPEQFLGERLGPASDLYSLGATLYALLTGRPPFQSGHIGGYMDAHLRAPLPDLSGLPAGEVIRRAMAKAPAQRYASATEMLQAIEAALSAPETTLTPTPPRRPLWPWLAGGAAVAVLIVAAIAWPRKEDTAPPGKVPPVPKEGGLIELKPASGPHDAGGPVLALAASPADENTFAWSYTIDRKKEKPANEMRLGPLAGPPLLEESKRHPINYLAFAPDGSGVAEYAAGLRSWAAGGGPSRAWDVQPVDDNGVLCTAMHPTGAWVALAPRTGPSRIVKRARDEPKTADLATDVPSRARLMAFAPDGDWLVTVHTDRRIRWWPDAGGAPSVSAPMSDVTRLLTVVAGSPPLAAVAVGRAVEFWHRGKGLVFSTEPLKTPAGALAASPDGRWLAVAEGDTVWLFDVKAEKTRAAARGHTGPVAAMAFTRSGRLVTGGADAKLRLWDPPAPK